MQGPIFSAQVFTWISRILAALFVGLLAFAWWDESQARMDPTPTGDVLFDYAITTHVLPAVGLLIVLIWAWNKPLVGVVGFGLYAALQLFAVGGEWGYLPLVMAPPLIICVMYLVSYLLKRKITT